MYTAEQQRPQCWILTRAVGAANPEMRVKHGDGALVLSGHVPFHEHQARKRACRRKEHV